MNTLTEILIIGVACYAAYLTYGVAVQAFKQFQLGPPKPLAMAVSVLVLVAIIDVGKGILAVILIPYAALGLALLLLFLLNIRGGRWPSILARAAGMAQQILQRWRHDGGVRRRHDRHNQQR